MYKKIILCLLMVFVTFTFIACNKLEKSPTKKESSKSISKFEQFENGLKENGINYEIITMAAEMVKAEEGKKYKLQNGKIELYRFKEESDILKEVAKNKSIKLEGYGAIPVEINDNMAMIYKDDGNKQIIMNIFNSLK